MGPMSKMNNKKPSLAVIAYETIVRKIISLEYEPGEHLEEKQLVEQLDIGRTPIREALQRLAGEKLVEAHPNKGIIVRPITLQNTKAMFEGMKIIELGVAELAVKKDVTRFIPHMEAANKEIETAIALMNIFDIVKANHVFHMVFAQCSDNEYLIRAVNEVRNHAKRLSYLSYDNTIDPDRPLAIHYDSVICEHNEIIAFLQEKDEDRLKMTIEEHIRTFQHRIILYMTS